MDRRKVGKCIDVLGKDVSMDRYSKNEVCNILDSINLSRDMNDVGQIEAYNISSDGISVISAPDGNLIVQDLDSNVIIKKPIIFGSDVNCQDIIDNVYDIQFSYDNKYVLHSGMDVISVIDTTNWEIKHQYPGNKMSSFFSQDSKYIVFYNLTYDMYFEIRHVETGKKICEYRSNKLNRKIECLSLSPDNKQLVLYVSISNKYRHREVWLYNVDKWKKKDMWGKSLKLADFQFSHTDCFFRSNNLVVFATTTSSNLTIRSWDIRTTLIHNVYMKTLNNQFKIESNEVTFSRDGKYLLHMCKSIRKDVALIVNLQRLNMIKYEHIIINMNDIINMNFISMDNKYLVLVCDNMVKLIEIDQITSQLSPRM